METPHISMSLLPKPGVSLLHAGRCFFTFIRCDFPSDMLIHFQLTVHTAPDIIEATGEGWNFPHWQVSLERSGFIFALALFLCLTGASHSVYNNCALNVGHSKFTLPRHLVPSSPGAIFYLPAHLMTRSIEGWCSRLPFRRKVCCFRRGRRTQPGHL